MRVWIGGALLLCLTAAIGPAQGEDVPAIAQPDSGLVRATGDGTVGLMADVSKPSAVWIHIKRHWWKYLGLAVVGYGVDRVADNNGWWWHQDDSIPNIQLPLTTIVDDRDGVAVNVSGNAGNVTVQINYKTTSVEAE